MSSDLILQALQANSDSKEFDHMFFIELKDGLRFRITRQPTKYQSILTDPNRTPWLPGHVEMAASVIYDLTLGTWRKSPVRAINIPVSEMMEARELDFSDLCRMGYMYETDWKGTRHVMHPMHRWPQRKPDISTDSSPNSFVNHDAAYQIAVAQQNESNLARAYLDLTKKLKGLTK